MEPLRCKPTAFARDEGRVLHSACCGIGFRIDHGQRLVWIRTVKRLETIQCLASDALVAFGLAPVRGLHQEPQFDRAHLRLVSRLAHFVARADGPGKIVDVIAVIRNRFRVIGVIHAADFDSAAANHLVFWNGQLYVVDAKIGEEFRGVVILMTIPRSMPPHPYFGEPLATQKKVTLPSGTRLGFWKLCDEGDLELNIGTGGEPVCGAPIDYRLIIINFVLPWDVL